MNRIFLSRSAASMLPLQRTARVNPARFPARRFCLAQSPLAHNPSLRPLRDRLPKRRCSATSPALSGLSDFPCRSSSASVLELPNAARGVIRRGGNRISRFSRKVWPDMHGVSDRAGLVALAISRRRWGLPLLLPASAPRRECSFAARYPARMFPCQRFDAALAAARMTRGRCGWLRL